MFSYTSTIMEHLVWTTGEKYEKSYKNNNPISKNKASYNVSNTELVEFNNINISTNNENNSNNNGFMKGSNKRELVNNKLNERNMISQIGQNPFMTNNNYINDLVNQQTFLIPQNSNFK